MKTADGSIVDSEGKVVFFSFDRFMSDIVRGNCCFICGVSPEAAAFNDEHRASRLATKKIWTT